LDVDSGFLCIKRSMHSRWIGNIFTVRGGRGTGKMFPVRSNFL
jgi:hypothetical protein